MPDIIDQQAEIVSKKKSNKKMIIILGGGVVLLLLIVASVMALMSKPKTVTTKTPDEQTIRQEETTIPASQTRTYKLEMPKDDSINAFIYYGEQTSVFSPLTAYTLTKGNRLISTPLSISATAQNGNPWCEGMGKDRFNMSQDQKAVVCLENIDNKNIVLRKIDLRKNEYKEFHFSNGGKDLFIQSRTSKVVSSKDTDSAIIYSPVGAYIFDSNTSSLYKIDLPLNLDIQRVVNLSGVESALITFGNKLYRINFSSRRGGVFEVNLSGTPQDKLEYGLSTARLSKDSRKIVYTVSEKIETFPTNGELNYPAIITYSIDLNSAKVSDELDYQEKFLVSCKNLVADKYCVYSNSEIVKDEKENGDKKDLVLYVREFDKPIQEVARARDGILANTMNLELNASTANYIFVKSAFNYLDKEQKKAAFPGMFFFNVDNKSLVPLTY